MKYLDWEKAEQFCVKHPDAIVWAGLRGDMGNTASVVYDRGEWCKDGYVYDRSCWATPILEYYYKHENENGEIEEYDDGEFECWTCEEHEHNGIPEWWGRNQVA